MQFSSLQYGFGLTATGSAQGVHSLFSGTIGTPIVVATYPVNPDIVYSVALQIAQGATLTLNLATGAITGTIAGTYQKETSTLIAAAGCTSNGDLALFITAAGLTGSPITVNVPLTTAAHTTQNLIAAQCRTTLQADPRVTGFFAVGGTTNTFILEKLTKQANDATLGVLIPAARGVSVSTSGHTTAGSAVAMAYRISGTVWDAKDAEGVPLATASKLYASLATCDSAGAGVVNVEFQSNYSPLVVPFIEQKIHRLGNHPWNALAVSFTAATADVLIFLDIHAGI